MRYTRDTSHANNRIEYYVLTHFKGVWDRVQQHRFLRTRINRALINRAIYKIPTRPFPFTTRAPYTSWNSRPIGATPGGIFRRRH